MKGKIYDQLDEIWPAVSLEDAVRRDIKEWLRDLDRRLSDIADISEDERKRAIKAAVRYQREIEAQFRFKFFVNSSKSAVEVQDSDKVLERFFELFTSAEYIRKYRQIVGEKLTAGDLPGAYQNWRQFEVSIQIIDMFLKQPDVRRGKTIARAALAGNEAAHGSGAEKHARWQRIHDDYEAEKAEGTIKAADVVAERHGVSAKTARRAKVYLSKFD